MEKEPYAKINIPRREYISLRDIPTVIHISKIRCGSYTTEWIARAMGLHPIPSNEIIRGPIWYDIFRPIFPSDMRLLFKRRGMESTEINLSKLNNQQRIDWIRGEIALKRKPPALLIRTRLLHWIAVGGYDDDRRLFYVYNSLHGSSSANAGLPIGNSVLGYDELVQLWRGRWWLNYRAIIVNASSIKRPNNL
jgi:hypothetical protein